MTMDYACGAMISNVSHNAKSALNAAQLLQQGQDAYANYKYEEARERFNKALAASSSQNAMQMHILDHQVGVFVKLKQLDQALTTAKSMVRSDRTDARGYLRCGQIQRLQEDHEAACKWYEHGLKNVSADDRLRSNLASSFDKTTEHATRQRTQSKPCDPTRSLPLEVVRMILGHLDYKDHVRLLGVSKPWRKLISSLPPITDTLDFTYTQRTISYNMLRAAVRRLTSYPKNLQLSMLSEPATRYLNERLGLWCKKPIMQHFELNDPRIDLRQVSWSTLPLQTLTLGSEALVNSFVLENILRQCGRLKTLVAESASTDTECLLQLPGSFSQPYLEKLILSTKIQFGSLSYFPNLVHLEYRRTSDVQLVEELDLTSNSKLRYVELSARGLFTTLPKGLEVMKAWTIGGFTIEVQSSLRHLELRFDPSLLVRYKQLLESGALDRVRTVAIEFNQHPAQFDQADVDFFFNHCANFEHVRLKTPLQRDSDYEKLIGTTPKLRSLIIEDAQITGAFLAGLFKAASCRVESISLRACSNVSSDTWDWIRQRGVMVDVRNSSERHEIYGGRRLVDLR